MAKTFYKVTVGFANGELRDVIGDSEGAVVSLSSFIKGIEDGHAAHAFDGEPYHFPQSSIQSFNIRQT